MAVSSDYLQFILEQLRGLGRVHSRRMFGAAGLYCDEVFFGIISDDTLYLRVDEASRGDYTARGMAAFKPYADRPEVSMTYFEVPADVLEDPEALLLWSRRSLATRGLGAAALKPHRRRPQRPRSERLR
jgi:DNA transformation protein